VDGRRSLTFLEDQVARRLAPRVPAPVLPPRVHARAIEFVEFAANEEESPQLASLFASLGFSAVGKHRHKDVTRWRQNGINFVINSEPDSFARAYDGLHGASVCALGLTVDDVGSAMRRAEGLRIAQPHIPSEPGELLMPAVLGVGGSLLYLMEEGAETDVWDREFEPTRATGSNAGLLRVDHIAQTMQYEEMLSWMLYYVSLFDLAKASPVQIPDPLGLVQSQAIESPEGGLRFTLNGSASHQTLSARFLQGFGGAGIQHIALATADIFASARRLRELGLQMLPIPGNYYEDLQARFELDDKRITELRELNILYDRDTNGEYFQLYSRAFAKRFFFEIVERRGYGAYGTTNAAIRLAAQSRYRDDAAL
jgi:4-hydroxyphenylpyruvate dioxygenase